MDPQVTPPAPQPQNTDAGVAQADSDAAAAFARAKISAIFGGAAVSQLATPEPVPVVAEPVAPELAAPTYPVPPATPMTPPQQLYQRETVLQDELQPTSHHLAPDHQLAAAALAPHGGFQTLTLPGQSVSPTVAPTPAAQRVPMANLVVPVSTVATAATPATVGSSMPPTRSQQIKQFATSGAQKLKSAKQRGHVLRPLIKASLVTSIVFLVYNAPLVLGQVHYYITPANSEPTPIILDESTTGVVGAEPKIIISKLNIDVPAVYDETSFDENLIQAALERGIVHYGTTAMPGDLGNAVFMGHSSNSPWAPGKFKTAFSLLRRLEVSDTFVLHFQGQRYIYEVYHKRIINPSDFSVIDQNVTEPIVTLITCDPPGANWNRLAIQARQISPDPSKAHAPATAASGLPGDGALPGSPPSLFDRVHDWLF